MLEDLRDALRQLRKAPGNPPGMEERVRKALTSVDPNLVLYG